jgi:Uma2 family endonuclease
MGEAARKRITVDEFLVWDDASDRRYELAGGGIVAMTPPLLAHATIVANAVGEIRQTLKPPCRVLTEVGIRLSWRDDTFYQADLAVTFTKFRPDDRHVPDPVVILEVLSPSTIAHDRGVKLTDYRHIDSVREIVLIASDERRVELWRRGEGVWTVADLGAGDRLRLDAIGFDIPVEALYDGLDFGEAEPAPG